MKKILLLLWLTPLSQAESLWGLSHDIENQIIVALELSRTNNLAKQNKMGSFVTVGDDSNCDFRVGTSKIQNAINSGASEIRIANNDIYEEIITINNPSVNLTIRGGFSSCIDATNNIQSDLQQDWTEIKRANGLSGSIFLINGLPSDNLIVFENIKIVGGNGQGNTSGGSLRLENTESDVILQNVHLTGAFNMATGGGLSIISSNTTVILNNATIDNNQSLGSGGGIFCDDFSGQNRKATIILNTTTKITNNITTGSGGGAFLSDGCFMASFAGTANPFPPNRLLSPTGTLLDASGITINDSMSFGGGVYLESGADLLLHGTQLCNLVGQCFGDLQNPANMIGNKSNTDSISSENGGGIYATGSNTSVTISASFISDNVAIQASGGAIAIENNAQLLINRNGTNCWDLDRCNFFLRNSASFTGGVIYNNNGNADISHTYFESSNANIGIVLYSTNSALTNVDASIFNNNGSGGSGGFLDRYLFYADNGSDYNFKYSTIADNDAEIGVFRIVDDPGTIMFLNSSIIDDQNSGPVLAFGTGASGFIGDFCLMAHELSSLPNNSNNIDDPEFVDRINRNYHLSNTSPAIDYCNVLTTPTNKDIDFQTQGWDNPDLSNLFGPYDIGADEAFSKNYFTIGTDASCDFNSNTQTIQNVIDTGVGEVRIANNGEYIAPIIINSMSVKLRGGYIDCNAADADNQTTHSTIDSPDFSAQAAITIQGVNLGNTILIESLSITGSEANDNSAISAINALADIKLNDVTISSHNQGNIDFGGGINLTGGAIMLELNDTIIINNIAQKGGGIYCSGAESSIIVKGNSGIAHNSSVQEGGGVYVTNDCKFTIFSGVSNPDASTNFGVSDNQAGAEGGGIYADLGATVTLYGHELCDNNGCTGNNTSPVNVNNNLSDSDSTGSERGGGIYLTGATTTVNIYAGLISDNLGPNGGGIYVNNLASLNIARLSADCWDITKCNYFLNNRSIATGGAIQSDQGQLNISSTYFEENEGSSGSALYAFGPSSFARIQGSVFNHNNNAGSADDYVIRAAAAATVEVIHSTFADNLIQNSATFGITSNSELRLFSSIINDPDGVVLDINPGTTTIDCVMTHESNSFFGNNIFLGDPNFVDRTNRNYHLSVDSTAIDVCDNSMTGVLLKDIDFEDRGYENIKVTNINGLFDIGADESLVNDTIFKNGFE